MGKYGLIKNFKSFFFPFQFKQFQSFLIIVIKTVGVKFYGFVICCKRFCVAL